MKRDLDSNVRPRRDRCRSRSGVLRLAVRELEPGRPREGRIGQGHRRLGHRPRIGRQPPGRLLRRRRREHRPEHRPLRHRRRGRDLCDRDRSRRAAQAVAARHDRRHRPRPPDAWGPAGITTSSCRRRGACTPSHRNASSPQRCCSSSPSCPHHRSRYGRSAFTRRCSPPSPGSGRSRSGSSPGGSSSSCRSSPSPSSSRSSGVAPRVDVLGLHLSEPGLWAAWNIIIKGTLGVAATVVMAATTPVPQILTGLERLRTPACSSA